MGTKLPIDTIISNSGKLPTNNRVAMKRYADLKNDVDLYLLPWKGAITAGKKISG